MRKLPPTIALAILLPSLLLGALAVRSAHQQKVVMHGQAVDLYQSIADRLALRVRHAMEDRGRDFEILIEGLLDASDASELAADFDATLRRSWPEAEIGFAVTMDGALLSPRGGGARVESFLAANRGFLTNRSAGEFYQLVQNDYNLQQKQIGTQKLAARNVEPRQQKQGPDPWPDALPASPDLPFQSIAAGGTSGSLSRFTGDRLELLFWKHGSARIVFGAMLQPAALTESWRRELTAEIEPGADYALALLDERGTPVAVSRAGLQAEWTRPFVATRVGETLPLWEAALYLDDPGAIGRQARFVQLGLIGMVVVAGGAIVAGSVLLARDTRRRLEWARLKSEFVSNVSHELKTPLTSIRMFAELLDVRSQGDDQKSREFARVIRLESERLSRLVENVLDFDKLERGDTRLAPIDFDAYPIVRQVWDTIERSLRAHGFETAWEAGEPPYRVRGVPDSLSQILVNLLSNAEKFAGERKEITLRTSTGADGLRIEVLDRGPGLDPRLARRIFEPFVRFGEQEGSGLGLYIARRLAEAQGGRLSHAPRVGGGSVFTLQLPPSYGEPT